MNAATPGGRASTPSARRTRASASSAPSGPSGIRRLPGSARARSSSGGAVSPIGRVDRTSRTPGTRRATARRSAQELESGPVKVLEDDQPRRRFDGGGDELDREVADRVGSDVGFELGDARRDGQLDRQDRVEKRCAVEQGRVAAQAREHGGLDDGVVGPVGGVDVEAIRAADDARRSTRSIARSRRPHRGGPALAGRRSPPAGRPVRTCRHRVRLRGRRLRQPRSRRAAPGARKGISIPPSRPIG